MDIYSIGSLLKFFMYQKGHDYVGIEIITDIMRCPDMSQDEKMDAILTILKEAGLEQLEIIDCDDFVDEDELIYEDEKGFRADTFQIELMNGREAFLVALN